MNWRAWLQLIRWKNLAIVFLTQALVWFCVIVPIQYHRAVPLLLTPVNFLLLAASTLLIAAAGYIINDYFDVKIDLINRPEKMVLEKQIPRKQAIIMHTVLNVAGLYLALIVARQAGHYEWIWVQLLCTVLLWFYSTHFKRQFIIGNVVVALLTALTIIVLIVYEPAMHYYWSREAFEETPLHYLYLNPVWLSGVYAYFAFILTWMREIVKDMEDFKGDAEQGCVTMPIQWGLQRSGWFAQGLGLLAVFPLTLFSVNLLLTNITALGAYALAALVLPLIAWIVFLNKKATTAHYREASRRLKLIMVLGIGSLIINYLLEWIRSY